MTNHNTTIHHLFIVDTFQRLEGQKSLLISQVNDSLDSIRHSASKGPVRDHRVTIMISCKNGIRCMANDLSISDIPSFESPISQNQPTKILDVIGSAIGTWRALRKSKNVFNRYQVSIFSSGRDKGSIKYTQGTLKLIIESLADQNWQFTMIGSHPLMPNVASQLGITNYYICKAKQTQKDRYFLIAQLKRQWQKQNQRPVHFSTSQKAA